MAEPITNEQQLKFNDLVTKAKQLTSEGDIQNALKLNKEAYGIYATEKLGKRIKKMEVSEITKYPSELDCVFWMVVAGVLGGK
jgi:hypothetical protein